MVNIIFHILTPTGLKGNQSDSWVGNGGAQQGCHYWGWRMGPQVSWMAVLWCSLTPTVKCFSIWADSRGLSLGKVKGQGRRSEVRNCLWGWRLTRRNPCLCCEANLGPPCLGPAYPLLSSILQSLKSVTTWIILVAVKGCWVMTPQVV